MAFVFDGAISEALANLARMLDAGELNPEPLTAPANPTGPAGQD